MAKIQKGLLLNDDLYRVIAQIEGKSGASFTRIVTAALIGYMFETPDGPGERWMQYAVSLENGELGVGDIPDLRLDDVRRELGFANLDAADHAEDLTAEARAWLKITQQKSKGVQKILDHRASSVCFRPPSTDAEPERKARGQ